jgi:hypothetical protein
MTRATHETERSLVPPSLGSFAAILGGVLFATWGYVHRGVAPWYFDVTAHVLNFIVPALFYVALAALYTQYRERVGRIGKFGFILGLAGSAMGVAYAVPWSAFATREDWLSSLVWLDTPLIWWLHIMLIGLPLAGISTMGARMHRAPGVLLLTIGAFGWAYYAADSGAILEARTAHVGFGALFSLGWIALGLILLKRGFQ